MATTQIDELLAEASRPAWQLGRARVLVLVVAAGVIASAAYLTFLRDGGSPGAAQQTATVQRGPVVTNVSLSGAVAARSTAELSFDEAGTVTAVHVTVGQQVKAGDLLAEVEAKAAEDAVTQAQLNLQSAQIRLDQLLEGPDAADVASANESVIQAQAALTKAEEDLKTLWDGPTESEKLAARQSVKQAEAGLAQARAARDKLNGTKPSGNDVAAANASVSAAELALEEAQRKQSDLSQPPTAAEAATATAAVEGAKAGLNAAEARRDTLMAGTKQSDVDLQRMQLQLLQLALNGAREKLDASRLYAPFDGTVADIAVQAGGPSTPAEPALTLNTPDALTLELTVSDADYASVKVGQKGFATVDSLDGASFPVEIVSLGTLPSSSQGVVTYKATARILDAPPQAQTSNGSAETTQRALPLPGMQAQITLIAEQKLDVLTLPSSAVQRTGPASTVQLQREDGAIETVQVTTGLSNGRVIEIVEGLSEGQTVVLPTASRSTSQQDAGGLADGIIITGPVGGAGGKGEFVFPAGRSGQ